MSPRPAAAPAATATLAQLKALADPLRYRIFENLVAEPRTAKQMAQHMGTHPTRLYHHFRVLERAGLIQPAGTRQTRGTVEKYFQAVTDRVEVRDGTGDVQAALVPALLESVLGSTLSDLQRSGPRRANRSDLQPYLKRYRIRATPKQAAEIHSRLEALSRLCERASAGEGAHEFALTLAFYRFPDRTERRKSR
jgi:DNA-binding transcriptional ArsR family regulator